MPRALAVLLALAATLACAAPAAATFPGTGAQISTHTTFGMTDGHFDDRMTLDDPADDQPAKELGAGANPVWSADGTKVAFQDYSRCEAIWGQGPCFSITSGIAMARADGSGRRVLVQTPRGSAGGEFYFDDEPAWAPDGEAVYFFRDIRTGGDLDQSELRRASLGGGDSRIGSRTPANVTLSDPAISPDGETILARRFQEAGSHYDVVRIDAGTGALSPVPGTDGAFSYDYAPDGKRIVVTTGGAASVIALEGERVAAGRRAAGPSFPVSGIYARFTPDGNRVVTQEGCSGKTCEYVAHLAPPPGAEPAPGEPEARSLGVHSSQSFDVQPTQEPIIFIHGFAGSKIACGDDELWVPAPFSDADLLNMRLGPDGVSDEAGTCGAAPTGIVDSALGSDVYQPALDWLEEIAPDNHRVFVWDWRKDPRLAIPRLQAEIQAALDQPLPREQGVKKVVLVGHSMGGLVMRAAINHAAVAKKVSRAVTVGTPYWGSPKAILPVAAGIEAPNASSLDGILGNAAFRALARNLTGNYFLFPSERYGPWLTVAGHRGFLNRAELEAYVAGPLGGNRELLARALDAHRDELDGFKRNGIDYRAFVGTGLNTLGTLDFRPGAKGEAGEIGVAWTSGDGTVPARSGAQGPIGGPSLGENVPISFVCGVAHVPLPGDPAVTEPLTDFLRYGTFPPRVDDDCENEGDEVRFTGIDLPSGGTRRLQALGDGGTLSDAAARGELQLLELAQTPVAVTDRSTPVEATVHAAGARLAVTPLKGDSRGAPAYYGPIDGELTLKTDAGGAVTVLDDGVPVTART
ncbi:MAG TPA: hypothetical protein VF533_06030, partial [Solirubrobacteraceae bacterium]